MGGEELDTRFSGGLDFSFKKRKLGSRQLKLNPPGKGHHQRRGRLLEEHWSIAGCNLPTTMRGALQIDMRNRKERGLEEGGFWGLKTQAGRLQKVSPYTCQGRPSVREEHEP